MTKYQEMLNNLTYVRKRLREADVDEPTARVLATLTDTLEILIERVKGREPV